MNYKSIIKLINSEGFQGLKLNTVSNSIGSWKWLCGYYDKKKDYTAGASGNTPEEALENLLEEL